MTIRELIQVLQRFPQSYEVATPKPMSFGWHGEPEVKLKALRRMTDGYETDKPELSDAGHELVDVVVIE